MYWSKQIWQFELYMCDPVWRGQITMRQWYIPALGWQHSSSTDGSFGESEEAGYWPGFGFPLGGCQRSQIVEDLNIGVFSIHHLDVIKSLKSFSPTNTFLVFQRCVGKFLTSWLNTLEVKVIPWRGLVFSHVVERDVKGLSRGKSQVWLSYWVPFEDWLLSRKKTVFYSVFCITSLVIRN